MVSWARQVLEDGSSTGDEADGQQHRAKDIDGRVPERANDGERHRKGPGATDHERDQRAAFPING